MIDSSHKAIMKKYIKAILPESLLGFIRYIRRLPKLLRSYQYDMNRYTRHSSAITYKDDEEKLRAIITATYHNIEKGLSLKEPRLGFGKENLAKLVGYLDEAFERYGEKNHLSIPISVIGEYVKFHESRNYKVDVLRNNWTRLQAKLVSHAAADTQHGGVIKVRSCDIVNATKEVTYDFFATRFSCRQFSDSSLSIAEIEFATRAAQKAPAVCNRQSGRIHAFLNKVEISSILNLQGGARGFVENVPTLFCITSDLNNFHGEGERYQGWIDGGLFAMSFLFGLHAQGIGTCCLNWSKDAEQDVKMRKLINIRDSETIIMFIAAGYIPESLVVARSVRKPICEVLNVRT